MDRTPDQQPDGDAASGSTPPSGQSRPLPPPTGRPAGGPPPSAPRPSIAQPSTPPASSQRGAPPPPYQAYPPPPPAGFKRGFGAGFGVMIGAGLVATVAAVIAFAMLASLLSLVADNVSPSSSDDAAVETVWGDEDAGTTIRSISVTGPILTHDGNSGGIGLFGLATYGYDVAEQLDSIAAGDADAVLLQMDTPGGTIPGSKAIGDAVQRYQERTGHPVIAFVRGISASGGMYAMARADEIIADHGTLVGSIGVILGPLQQYEDVKAIDGGLLGGGVTTDGGITQEYFTQGKGKDFGNPWRAITPEERRIITAGLNDEYDAFVTEVSEGRDIPAATIRRDLGAYIYSPQQAIDNGLVDVQLGAEEAFRRAAEAAGGDPEDARLVAEAPLGFLASLTGADAGSAAPSTEELEAAEKAVRRSEVCAGSIEVLAVHARVALCQ